MKLNLKVKRPLESTLYRGLADFTIQTPKQHMDDVVGVYLGEEEPKDLTATAVINGEEMKLQIKDWTINIDHERSGLFNGPPTKSINLTGYIL